MLDYAFGPDSDLTAIGCSKQKSRPEAASQINLASDNFGRRVSSQIILCRGRQPET